MMLDLRRGPLSTTAAAVSSHEVSTARILRSDQARSAGRAIQPLGFQRFQDLLKTLLEAGRMNGVGPHDDGVLVVVGVVAAPTADHLEAELFVQPHRHLI